MMMLTNQEQNSVTTSNALPSPLLPLTAAEATLATVGGKGANLARLARAGFPVPDGFLTPTSAYSAFVTANQLDRVIDAALSGLVADDPAALETAAANIRAAFAAGAMAPALRAALAAAYRSLGEPPVAVRSSATAEDLPDMSFAGQQDTYLNIVGVDALCAAVVQCWGSLWTARAIGYRARNQVAQDQVALAVVVQRMVQAEASGVLFTANPLTGRRSETVIDATLGLGEALVSGQVEPDHYVVDAAANVILHKSMGAKATVIVGRAGGGTTTQQRDAGARQAIPDPVILEVAALGQRVAAHYDAPQDIEWTWAEGQVALVQARPITSLFPLPDNMPAEPLQAMMSFAAVQGIFEPITPLGQDALKLAAAGASRAFGFRRSIEQQTIFYSAAERLFVNFTPVLRSAVGRNILPRIIVAIDPGVAAAFAEVVNDPRMTPARRGISFGALRRLLGFALPMAWRIRRAWRDPERARMKLTLALDAEIAGATLHSAGGDAMWEDFAHRLQTIDRVKQLSGSLVPPHVLPVVVAGMIPFFGILQRFAPEAAKASGRAAVAQLPLEIARSLPHNVTTEMDLALWATAQTIHTDAAAATDFAATPADALAAAYLAATLPPVVQEAVTNFMQRYGMRGLGEIDLGRPRWREAPTHIMQVLQSYLTMTDPAHAPDQVFARGSVRAATAIDELAAAVAHTRGGFVKARLVRWAASRYRALAGLREAPKFFAIRMMGVVRQGLLASGAEFAAAGLLEQADDLFYLRWRELQAISRQQTITPAHRALIAERRARYATELRRRQQPRVLLSDGTAYYAGVRNAASDDGAIVGDPVSPGVVEGIVRVVLNPLGTRLAPGEILVCPGTDPAWTPLFLAAGGLVMEVGGMMTHGSVVAREYGIPAVVGVHQATTRLRDGQRVRVDGASGVITVLG
jgi:phosphohistidine swiveling domain-containing protein